MTVGLDKYLINLMNMKILDTRSLPSISASPRGVVCLVDKDLRRTANRMVCVRTCLYPAVCRQPIRYPYLQTESDAAGSVRHRQCCGLARLLHGGW